MRADLYLATLALGVLPALATSACARSAEERQLDEMRSEIDKIQSERDDADRTAMQPEEPPPRRADEARPAAPATTAPPPTTAAPPTIPLQPIRVDSGDELAPAPESAPSEDTEDPTPRPTFRLTGSSRSSLAQPSNDPGSASTSAVDPEARRAYDAALALVTAKHCDRALGAFAAFLVRWPDHPYADNAMFWRGECYFQAGDYAHAAEQLEGVLARFPGGNKAPDALLKLGLAEAKLGDAAKAKECFGRLLELYPQSDAARRVPPTNANPAATPRGPAPEDSR